MDFAREFGLSVQVIEKDYALGWLLAGIAAHPGSPITRASSLPTVLG